MKSRFLFANLGLILIAAFVFPLDGAGQGSAIRPPRQEKLLNGLKVLMWNDPAADKVTVKIRVHSGSAFDPQAKEGVMKLLAENIFPTREARDFFADDLGGGLEIVSNYDYIQINSSARPAELLTLLETLAAAVSNPAIDRETTEKLKTSLLAEIERAEKDQNYIADQAAASRLFGTFPYGRPQLGTRESVQKIDFADLRFAKDRFFGADNATIAIVGNFIPDVAFRAVRRYFGVWLKSDNKVPSTFRQPDEPDTKPLEVSSSAASDAGVRFALRGLARSDRDFAASVVLSRILRSRLQGSGGASVTVTNDARTLPGVVSIGLRGNSAAPPLPSGLFTNKITEDEFGRARTEILIDNAGKPVVDLWLDADTYKTRPADDVQAIQNVTLADVQRVADRLSKNPVVTVVVRPPVATAKP